MLPSNAQRRMHERLNKTVGNDSKVSMMHNQEKSRAAVLKKIVTISSIKQEIKKILLKYLDNGFRQLDSEANEKILSHSKNILDNDKQKQLNEDLNNLMNHDEEPYTLCFKIIRQLVISPIEKSYICKIEKQLREDQNLERDIKQIQEKLEEQKNNKLREYQGLKSGGSPSEFKGSKSSLRAKSSQKIRTDFKNTENFENHLMRANQKLNEMSSNNNKLRSKINQLRKEKNAMEDIYSKLKKELENKKENVQKTIKFAGEAYNARNKAEDDLKNLKEQSHLRKEQFKDQCQKLNGQIQHDLRFKQFIKSKEIQREELQKLERQIEENESNIQLKKQENRKIDQEYKKSLEKEMEIKKSFDRIKHEIGCHDTDGNKDLLGVFVKLYEKNIIMKKFVEEINQEVGELQHKIELKKQEIQQMYLKGSANEEDRDKLNEQHKNQFEFYQKKKNILDTQYEKSINTVQAIKKYLRDIFEEIGIDPDVIEKLKSSNLNQDNLTQFLGQLEKKGLDAICHYGRLVSEQLKAEKGNNWEMQKQIDELNNIMTLQNVSTMNNCSSSLKIADYPSQLIIKVKEDKSKEEELDKPLTLQDFKKFAVESLEQYQKKQVPKEKHFNKKYNIAPMTKISKKR